jgi:hypothetical protein
VAEVGLMKQVSIHAGDEVESTVPHPSFPKNIFYSGPSGEGTITCFAKNQAGKPVLLTCSHVMFPGFAAVPNMRLFSPDYSSCCCSGDPVASPVFDKNKAATPGTDSVFVNGYHQGKWFGGMSNKSGKVWRGLVPGFVAATDVDAAIAELDPRVHFKNAWPDGTIIKGVVPEDEIGAVKGPKLGDPIAPEQYVRIYSSQSKKVVYGTLLAYPESIAPFQTTYFDPEHVVWPTAQEDELSDSTAGTRPTINRFMILPRPGPSQSYNEFRKLGWKGGDSGSAVINHENLIIGMLTRVGELRPKFGTDPLAGIPEFNELISGVGHATLIHATLKHLNITIPNDPSGWEGTVPARGTDEQLVAVPHSPLAPALDAQRRGIERLRDNLSTTRRGRLLLGKIGQHRSEVRRLITGVRAIAAVWRDQSGAAFFNHCMRSAADSRHIVPTSINGVKRAELLRVLLPLLAQHGSAQLKRDLERYGAFGSRAVLEMSRLQDLPDCLAARELTEA